MGSATKEGSSKKARLRLSTSSESARAGRGMPHCLVHVGVAVGSGLTQESQAEPDSWLLEAGRCYCIRFGARLSDHGAAAWIRVFGGVRASITSRAPR